MCWVPALCQVPSGMLFVYSFTLQNKLPKANILHILQMWRLKFIMLSNFLKILTNRHM